jgi:hypothetical protein
MGITWGHASAPIIFTEADVQRQAPASPRSSPSFLLACLKFFPNRDACQGVVRPASNPLARLPDTIYAREPRQRSTQPIIERDMRGRMDRLDDV